MDRIIKAIERSPELLENHGVAFGLIAGTVFCLLGYFGAHWINRRKFYRRRAGRDPTLTYFKAWRTSMMEGSLGVVCFFSMMFGFLCLLAGLVDWIDG